MPTSSDRDKVKEFFLYFLFTHAGAIETFRGLKNIMSMYIVQQYIFSMWIQSDIIKGKKNFCFFFIECI